ncbi:hypothetical Protein YC6258_00299 [Gynuella sunshinyii YC6258]|uniref:Uncharacterized protein n=1 Tax=Gynuella sunshinyii YC6258 TaxID=1445510 RepID=A0A0C5VQ03_9GAMM|nr:hypothetical Protein YC6258_00299 [Gynuella sunshinyii YC6258]
MARAGISADAAPSSQGYFHSGGGHHNDCTIDLSTADISAIHCYLLALTGHNRMQTPGMDQTEDH